MCEVLSRAQPYIQFEVMKISSNHSAKTGDHGGKSKSPHEASTHVEDQNWGQHVYKRQALPILSASPLRAYKSIEQFTLLRLSINEVFNAIKDQPWIRRPRPIQYDHSHPRAEEYCYHDCKGHKTIHCRSLQRYLEELFHQGFLKKHVLTPEAASRSAHLSTPLQPQHTITQYKTIE